MNGDREPGFPRGLFGASEEMEALLVDIQAVLARHGFRGMAIEAIELYPVTDSALDGGAASIQGYVRSSALPRPDIPSYPLDPGVGTFIKAGPARRCPDGKPADFRCFATSDGKVQCRWVCP
jgi:hypothetical protein